MGGGDNSTKIYQKDLLQEKSNFTQALSQIIAFNNLPLCC